MKWFITQLCSMTEKLLILPLFDQIVFKIDKFCLIERLNKSIFCGQILINWFE